jgi:hypothetical protein
MAGFRHYRLGPGEDVVRQYTECGIEHPPSSDRVGVLCIRDEHWDEVHAVSYAVVVHATLVTGIAGMKVHKRDGETRYTNHEADTPFEKQLSVRQVRGLTIVHEIFALGGRTAACRQQVLASACSYLREAGHPGAPFSLVRFGLGQFGGQALREEKLFYNKRLQMTLYKKDPHLTAFASAVPAAVLRSHEEKEENEEQAAGHGDNAARESLSAVLSPELQQVLDALWDDGSITRMSRVERLRATHYIIGVRDQCVVALVVGAQHLENGVSPELTTYLRDLLAWIRDVAPCTYPELSRAEFRKRYGRTLANQLEL